MDMMSVPIEDGPNTIYRPHDGKIDGTIGIVCGDQARYSQFTSRIVALAQSYPSVKFHINIGLQLTHARNVIMEQAEGDWLWFMDDDHTFEPSVLQNLLNRNLPIIGPLYTMRRMPPKPVARMKTETGWATPNIWTVRPGIYKVDATGTAGMLIRREVWEAMAEQPQLMPWFQVGTGAKDLISEDVTFCENAKKCGFGTFLDTTQVLGHLVAVNLVPEWKNNQWMMSVKFPSGSIDIPCRGA